MAQLEERRTRDPKTQGSNAIRSTRTICEFFRVKNVMLTRQCAQPPCVYIHTHKNDHVRMLKILSMVEFGGLRKHEKTQHALVGLGRAALAADVALPS